MLAKALRPSQKGKRYPSSVPAGTRVYAVGDIHGRLDLLQALHDEISRDAATFGGERRVLIYLGDYVDRGPQSRDVVETILGEPPDGFEVVCLKGNHEQLLLDSLEDAPRLLEWMMCGGKATLGSYGIDCMDLRSDPAGLQRIQGELRDKLPERHLDFFRSLPLSHQEGDYLFVHAGIRPGVAIHAQQEFDLLWIRQDFLETDYDFGKVVVHGHTITRAPDVKKNRIGIDTGAFASGVLTCLVLENDSGRFLSTREKMEQP